VLAIIKMSRCAVFKAVTSDKSRDKCTESVAVFLSY
jgi:hypothetical protein